MVKSKTIAKRTQLWKWSILKEVKRNTERVEENPQTGEENPEKCEENPERGEDNPKECAKIQGMTKK